MSYAKAHQRLIAYAFDVLFILAFYFTVGLLLGTQMVFGNLSALPMLGIWWYGGMILFAWLYFAVSESSAAQATFGKKIMRLRVTCTDGNPITFARATARFFGKALSRLLFFLGFLMVLFTKKKQALHDKIARTVVLKKH